MGRRMGQDQSDYKTQLVLEVCSISTRSVVCVHRHVSNHAKPSFIDWYCILGVEENAGMNTIRKQYHKLALQLHPDKNTHPKAEIAFKLVSEAHICLSDAAKRKAFDLKRHKNFCFECNRIPYSTSKHVPGNSNCSTFKTWNIIRDSRSYKVLRYIRDMRERLKEETKVIENCLRKNSMSKKESPLYNPDDYRHGSSFKHKDEKEIPIFNPLKYLYKGYPHLRCNVYKNSEACWYLHTQNLVDTDKGEAKYASPVFEVRSQRSMLTRSKFA
ncbi:dnaJ-related protein rsp1-like [Glycine soja]|uniref:Chaperone protein dnaJ 49 n=1 Tax=Glycine soja TaxID=3848 RepID=A0A445IWJ7_GLYSO|nr:dnaJ-related protein rsp1-like [Glycine soja]KHN26518.1 Chaperone protein dnaJ 49 [Glycine soja]RZB90533.1 Chaperone protein dnaJ 49 [Glycine soja]